MPIIRKTTMIRLQLASGLVLELTEQEAIELGDALIARALVGQANQRRLAFGEQRLENHRPTLRLTERHSS